MNNLDIFGFSVSAWILAPMLFAGWVFTGLALKKGLMMWLERLTQKTSTDLDDILVGALNRPLVIFILVSGGMFVFDLFIPPHLIAKFSRYVVLGFKIGTVVSIVLFANHLVLGLIKSYSSRIEVLRLSHGLVEVVVQVLMFAIGGMILLDSFGISITPFIASLGIGSLAVALALQPTFENLISGFQIILDGLVAPGQFVKLETGEEGYVEKVGWRSTWIRQLPNNMVIVPNKILINSRILNFDYPSKPQAVMVNLGVHYSSGLDKVERITIEVAADIMKRVPGGVPEFQPIIRYHTLGASSIDFVVVLQAQSIVDGHFIKHEFIKALIPRYAKEGIIVPYPITAVNTEQEKALFKSALS